MSVLPGGAGWGPQCPDKQQEKVESVLARPKVLILDHICSSSDLKVTPQLLSMYQTMFSMFDKDGDGTIDTKELGTLLRSLGKNPSPDEV